MPTTKDQSFDEILNNHILNVIQDQIETQVENIKKQVCSDIEDSIDKIVAGVAIKISNYVSVKKFGEDIRITIKKEK